MGNGGSLMTGHPTVGANLAIIAGVNQALASQATWWINPVQGRNTQSGKTPQTAIQSRSEFYRRMRGVTLTQPVTINVSSSLNADDVDVAVIYGSSTNVLNWVGTPTVLATGVITALTNRNPGANTVTLMTVGVIDWSTLVGKLVEQTGAAARGIVVKDLGSHQAWISCPVDASGHDTSFTNGAGITVYDMPSMGTTVAIVDLFATYKYFSATTWQTSGKSLLMTACFGTGINFGSAVGVRSCQGDWTIVDGHINVQGGLFGCISGQGTVVRFASSSTIDGTLGIRPESGLVTTTGFGGTAADLEYFGNASNLPMFYGSSGDAETGSRVFCTGFVYGDNGGGTTNLAIMGTANGTLSFQKTPTVTGATDIVFTLEGRTDKVVWAATAPLMDTHGNLVIGPTGQVNQSQTLRLNVAASVQGLNGQNFDRNLLSTTNIMIGGTVYLVGVGLVAGELITNLYFQTSVGGTNMTLSKMGLYDKAGNRLALSADQGTAWATAGNQKVALITPYRVPTTDYYYIALVATATVLPTMARGGATSPPISGKPPVAANMLAQSDLPPTVTFGTTSGILSFWTGWN